MLDIRKEIKTSTLYQELSDNIEKLKEKIQKYEKKLKKLS
jgi:hypothetical protein